MQKSGLNKKYQVMEVPRRWLVVPDASMRGAGFTVSDVSASLSVRWC